LLGLEPILHIATVLSAASLVNFVRSVSDRFVRKRSSRRIVFGNGCPAWLIWHVSASFFAEVSARRLIVRV
jgi:hypothetical protein